MEIVKIDNKLFSHTGLVTYIAEKDYTYESKHFKLEKIDDTISYLRDDEGQFRGKIVTKRR